MKQRAKVVALVCGTEKFKPGDPAPSGYVAWHQWAKVQHRAGLRQLRCHGCGKYRFPQEECQHEEKPR